MADAIVFYMDEHVPRAITEGLRRRGVNAITIQETGRIGLPDDEQLLYATQHGWTMFTQDEDFLRLPAADIAHAGIVFAAQRTPFGDVIEGLVLIADVLTAQEIVNRVEYL